MSDLSEFPSAEPRSARPRPGALAESLVLRPGDAGYEDELAGFQTGFTQRPELIVRAANAGDARAAVAYAAARGLPVSVQATGHGLPGPAEGGLLITTRRMDGVRIDAAARTARVEAGVRWSQVVEAAAPHGLAPLNGSAPGTGAVSYTLGGGLGLLSREYGYAADRVSALDLVTADGRQRRVTPESEPDLFWALRGGGHGLGVVTALETGLVPVARLYGGSLLFDGGRLGDVVRTYLEWTRSVPDTVNSSVAVVQYPDLPMLPDHLRGRHTASVRVAFTGGTAEGERLVAPLRAIGPTLADSLREMPYTESASIHNDPPSPHPYYGDSALIRDGETAVLGKALGKVLALTGPGAPMMCVVQVNHLGGALAKEPPVANAVPHREAGYLVRVLCVLDPEAGADADSARALSGRAFGHLDPLTLGRSVNFSFGGGGRTRGMYGAGTARRLAGLKADLDPANLFSRGPYGSGLPRVSPGVR